MQSFTQAVMAFCGFVLLAAAGMACAVAGAGESTGGAAGRTAGPATGRAATNPAAAGAGGPVAVVELFTSEGCSGCPPADDLLSEIVAESRATDRRVFPLAFHVDYWDDIGWPDPFADPAFSRRQRAYARAFRSDQVYTPQMVVNGAVGFVGSDRAKATREIAAALEKEPAVRVTLAVEDGAKPGTIVVTYATTPTAPDRVLNVALVERGLSVTVRRGENAGKVLRHDNVVRAFQTRPLGDDHRGRVELAVPAGVLAGNASVVGYVQDGRSMAISGATAVHLPTSGRSADR